MIDFDFQVKTKLFFGKGKENNVGEIISSFNGKRVLVVIGKGSVKKTGLLDRVLNSLNHTDISYKVVEGVRANPTIDFVNDALVVAKEFDTDFVLAVGGGSVMDTAKSIAVGYYYDGDPFDFNLHKVSPRKALPVGCILTISASGSEMSTSCVIQNDSTQIKTGFNSELIRPVFAIENPELSFSVSKEQTAYGIVDIMMHTLERYFQKSSPNEPADRFAEGLLKSVMDAGRVAYKNPNDYDARSVLMLMSSLSHNGLTNIGKSFGMPVHQLEHALSGVYPNVAHGEGLALLWPAWADCYVNYDTDKFDTLARNLFGLNEKDKLLNAKNGIQLIKQFFKMLNMPTTYKELGIDNVDIPTLVARFSNNGTRVIGHHVKPMDQNVALEIFNSCI